MGELVTGNRRFERERRARLRAGQLAARVARDSVLDPLTGLANRGFFVEQLEHALAGGTDGLAVFCIDLDRFKLVNDSLGHDAGDRLLIEVARRLRETLRAGDTIARLGEDEFTILCEDCPDAATARVIARRLNDVLSEPVRLDDRPVFTSGSIGVLLPAGDGTSAEEVMRDAALDDFGTGYSSLAILRQLPIGILKIDRAFMAGDVLAAEDAAIIEAVIGLARALGLRAVAEGIETAAQWSELKRLACEYAQGYFFSRPLCASELGALLDT